MSGISESQSIGAKGRKAEVITSVMGIITLLFPAQVVLLNHPEGEFAAYVMGMLWMTFIGSPIPINGGSSLPPTMNPSSLLGNLPGAILKFVFVLQMYRFYQGSSSKKTTLLIGIAAELLPILMFLPTSIASNQIPIPIPILLLSGLLLIYLSPPISNLGTWKSLEEPKAWNSDSSSDA